MTIFALHSRFQVIMSKKLFYIIFWTIEAALFAGLVLVICNWSAEPHSKTYYIGMLMISLCSLIAVQMGHFKNKIIRDNSDKTKP